MPDIENLASEHSVKELAAYIHASCVDTAFKLYKEGSAEHNKALEIAQRPQVNGQYDAAEWASELNIWRLL